MKRLATITLLVVLATVAAKDHKNDNKDHHNEKPAPVKPAPTEAPAPIIKPIGPERKDD